MLCERILGNLERDPIVGQQAEVDWLDLTWLDCTRRALRKRTRAGTQVKLLMPIGEYPRHGDILFRTPPAVIAVNLLPAEVLVTRSLSALEMGRLAIELGNLHVPVEVGANDLATIPEGPTEALLKQHGVTYQVERRRFVPERCSVASLPATSNDFSISVKTSQT